MLKIYGWILVETFLLSMDTALLPWEHQLCRRFLVIQYNVIRRCALIQVALIAASGACAGPDLVSGGCSCSYCIALQLVLVVVTENKQKSEIFMAIKKGKGRTIHSLSGLPIQG